MKKHMKKILIAAAIAVGAMTLRALMFEGGRSFAPRSMGIKAQAAEDVQYEVASVSRAPAGARSRSSRAPSETNLANSSGRMISYVFQIELNVRDLNAARKIIAARTEDVGGYVASESKQFMDIYVPAKGVGGFIEFLGDNVGKITDQTRQGRDVTDSYGDTAAELTIAYAARVQYTNLLKRADRVKDILEVEKELERVNAKILRLEQQKKRTEKSVELSNVEVRLDDSSAWDNLWPFALAAALALASLAGVAAWLLLKKPQRKK